MGIFEKLFPKTRSRVLHISSQSGLHLRPAASFAAEARKYTCSITAESRGESVDAKVLNALLSLDLQKGDHFELICKGANADKALEALTAHFEQLMQQESSKASIENENVQPSDIPYQGNVCKGEALFGGIAIAPAAALQTTTAHSEGVDFKEAVTQTLTSLKARYEEKPDNPDREIFLAQYQLLESLGQEVETFDAFSEAVAAEITALQKGGHASKSNDYRDILEQVKSQMGQTRRLLLPKTPYILTADDLLPSDIALLTQSPCQGVLLKKTSPASHAAILLCGAAIPSLIIDTDNVKEGEQIILDADCAVAISSPSTEDLALAQQRQTDYNAKTHAAYAKRHQPSETSEGKRITILANVSNIDEAHHAKEAGAEGIGLLRTEFLFTQQKPTLKQQQETYTEIFSLFDTVTVRTLDVGGDKSLPYLDLPKESNPFLGIRGIRLLQYHPELIEEQLLAIFRAAKTKSLKIMFPMVATPEEFTAAKSFAMEVAKRHRLDISHHTFGMMIEIPSVLFGLDTFDKLTDFYSVGTNDLMQYLFAIERTHPTIKVDSTSPLLYKTLSQIVEHSHKPLSLCGELAADPYAMKRMIEIGIDTFSISPGNIPKIKEAVRHV
jgi:phosphotransferase system HPr (HPr) family protein